MSINLKPTDELIVTATGVSLVYAIFSQSMPPYCDVRADKPGNVNTHKSTKMAAITSTAVIGSLSLISKSKSVFVVGAAMILFETWKYHAANYGANGTAENQAAASY